MPQVHVPSLIPHYTCSRYHNVTDALPCHFNMTLKYFFAIFCCFSSQLVPFCSVNSPIDFAERKKGGLIWYYLKCRGTLQTNLTASATDMLYVGRKHAAYFGGV